MAISKIDSDGITAGGITADSLNIGQIGGRRNLIINGAMQVHQRTGTLTVDNGWKYTLDRFRGYANASDGVYTVEQSTTAPAGFYKSCKLTVTTADASIGSTQLYMFGTALEGNDIQGLKWGTASAETVTLSFWVRSSLTGTFGVTITQGDTGNPSYPASYTISSADTWEHKTITIEGPTVGTWAAGTSATLQINFDLGCGADNRGTAGSWINTGNTRYGTTGATDVIATNGATLYITGVQLEVGSVATPFEHRSYGEELALCSRYFQVTSSHSGFCSSTTGLYLSIACNPPMRAAPTGSSTTPLQVNIQSANVTQSSAGVDFMYSFSGRGGMTGFDNFSGLVSQRPAIVRNSDSFKLLLDAEL